MIRLRVRLVESERSLENVRLLLKEDVPEAISLSDLAGWNQTPADWARLIALQPDGCFCVAESQRIVATATIVSYGPGLAWIGMVLTHPDHRGRGHASRLLDHVIGWADARQIRCTKLDATAAGEPLYRARGFEAVEPVERWLRAPQASVATGRVPLLLLSDPAAVVREADDYYQSSRRELLTALATEESSVLPGRGFAMGRAGRNTAYFGPCGVCDSEAAASLVAGFVERHHSESICWDLLPSNQIAVAVARKYGFEPSRKLVRMARPHPTQGVLEHEDDRIFAICGFEYG
jgi:GNAT superfamily N-acetyltransferase